MKFTTDPERTRYDFYFADDLADALNALAAVLTEGLSLADVLVWLAQRWRLEVHDNDTF